MGLRVAVSAGGVAAVRVDAAIAGVPVWLFVFIFPAGWALPVGID